MIKYPSTDQFRHIIKQVRSAHDFQGNDAEGKPVYEHRSPYPMLMFEGTVKLHGTNGAIVFRKDKPVEFQSRNRVLSAGDDNAGFYATMSQEDLSLLESLCYYDREIVYYGEWCGGNIQKGVAISGLPKMLVIFAVLIDGKWSQLPFIPHSLKSKGIYSISQSFPVWSVYIDFNSPETAQNTIVDLTLQVEEKCPVGAYFGNEGIGEGLVFTCITDRSLRFKSKGEKHSVSKVTTLAAVDTEALASINAFVDLAVTDQRLHQGIDYLKEMGLPVSQKSTGDYLRWVVNDVAREEADTIEKSGFSAKALNPVISKRAKEFFFSNLES